MAAIVLRGGGGGGGVSLTATAGIWMTVAYQPLTAVWMMEII